MYVGALQSFQAVCARIVALPITGAGTSVTELETVFRSGLRRIVHTVSNFHNPSGVTASAHTRIRLAELADQYGFLAIEDDPYGALRFTGDPIDPIPGDRVIRLGSASKILAPALRVGWMQAPPSIVGMVERLRPSADLCGSAFSQLTADLLSDTGWLADHVDRLCAQYRVRATALTDALDHRPRGPDRLAPTRRDVLLGAPARCRYLQPPACRRDQGVAFVPGRAFAVSDDLGEYLRRLQRTTGELDEASDDSRRRWTTSAVCGRLFDRHRCIVAITRLEVKT